MPRLHEKKSATEGETQSFRRQGWFRPTIGALLGVVSYILLKGGLVSIASPTATADKVLYFGGIAFLAGFSETQRKRVLRKIDLRLVPMLTLLYLVSYIDRANIGWSSWARRRDEADRTRQCENRRASAQSEPFRNAVQHCLGHLLRTLRLVW